MRRSIIMLLILLVAAILYVLTMRTGPEPTPSGSQLSLAFAKANATPKEAVLEARIQVPAGGMADQQVQAELEQLALALMTSPVTEGPGEDKGPIKYRDRDTGFDRESVAAYVLRDETMGLELELSFKRNNPAEPGFLLARATLEDPSMLPPLENRWRQVFHSRGYRPRYSTLLTGTLKGLETYNEEEALMAEVFQILAVENPWQVRDSRWISGGGYSPLISNPLLDARGEPVNVQVALRYHPLDECTYLYIGSPLIYREF